MSDEGNAPQEPIQEPTPQEPNSQEPTPQEPTPNADEPKWFFSEGVAGEGDAPEWFKSDKYKNVEEQAKAYKELEGKFGAFTGAPEEYTLELSDAIKEKGIEIEDDDHILEAAKEYAKDSNMSQEGFNKLVDMYVMTKIAEQEAFKEYQADEMKALGDNAQARIDNLTAWANKNIPPDLIEGFTEMASTAQSVKAMEAMIAMTRASAMNPDTSAPVSGHTASDVQAMQFEKDQYGNRRIQTDPAFRKEYEKMRDEVYGTEPHRKKVA